MLKRLLSLLWPCLVFLSLVFLLHDLAQSSFLLRNLETCSLSSLRCLSLSSLFSTRYNSHCVKFSWLLDCKLVLLKTVALAKCILVWILACIDRQADQEKKTVRKTRWTMFVILSQLILSNLSFAISRIYSPSGVKKLFILLHWITVYVLPSYIYYIQHLCHFLLLSFLHLHYIFQFASKALWFHFFSVDHLLLQVCLLTF